MMFEVALFSLGLFFGFNLGVILMIQLKLSTSNE